MQELQLIKECDIYRMLMRYTYDLVFDLLPLPRLPNEPNTITWNFADNVVVCRAVH